MTDVTLRRAAALTALILLMVGAAAVPPSDSSVRGSVRHAAGSPAGGVWVVLRQGDAERSRALTADDGRYFIANLEPGDYRVDVLRGQSVVYRGQVTLPPGGTASFDIVVP
jgi:hypothetical protein